MGIFERVEPIILVKNYKFLIWCFFGKIGVKTRKTEERKEGSTSEIVKLIYEYKPLIQEEHTIAKTTNRRDI